MFRMMPLEVDLLNLAQKEFMPDEREYATSEHAYKNLVKFTKQDFGYDVDAWLNWLKENTENWDRFGVVERVLKGK